MYADTLASGRSEGILERLLSAPTGLHLCKAIFSQHPDGAGTFTKQRRNRRSLHYAPPDFLWNLVALANFVRLSLRKAAYVVVASAPRSEIWVRSVEKH